jgi:hypothetical protein
MLPADVSLCLGRYIASGHKQQCPSREQCARFIQGEEGIRQRAVISECLCWDWSKLRIDPELPFLLRQAVNQ